MIHFELKHIDETEPAGTDSNLRMNWFWLTGGDLWIDLKSSILYEYTKEAQGYFGNNKSSFNNYPIVRFIEDFADIFDSIHESVPKEIYDLTLELETFYKDAEVWWSIIDPNEEEMDYKSFELYDTLISWAYNRSFNSGHLIGGPTFSFFRHNDKIRIVWKTEYQLDNGIDIWTAKNGFIEIKYLEFITQIKNFGERFFDQMKIQVEFAVKKDWKNVQIDKKRLMQEHEEREKDFFFQLIKLENNQSKKTNWELIKELNNRMKKEIKTKV